MNVFRKDGKIVIEIPETTLVNVVSQIPDYGAGLIVVDKDKFLNYFKDNVLESGAESDELSYVCRAFENIIEEAYEVGAGLEENQN